MATVKGLVLFCVLITLYRGYCELESRPSGEYSNRDLGLSSIAQRLKHTGYMGYRLTSSKWFKKQRQTRTRPSAYLAILLICAGDIETNPGPSIAPCVQAVDWLDTMLAVLWKRIITKQVPQKFKESEYNIISRWLSMDKSILDHTSVVKEKDELRKLKAGEMSKWLTKAKALLDTAFSMAPTKSVISSLLLLSGDVEENPGPGQGEELKPENIREVLEFLWDYRSKWKLIGIELGIDLGSLNAIEIDRRNCEDCLIELLSKWLRGSNPMPTRSAMIAAFQSKCVACCVHVSSIQAHDGVLSIYVQYLKSLYRVMTLACSCEDVWPPPIIKKVFRLSMIKTIELIRIGYKEDDSVRQKRIEDKVDSKLVCSKLVDSKLQKLPIELEDIFKESEKQHDQKENRQIVLMEGGPGCGKSTLSLHICHQWAGEQLFQEYRLVILVKLRELSVQGAESIAELLPRRSHAMGQEIEQVVTETDGSDLLFVLDGWDEFPQNAPAYKMILNIIKGEKLPKSSVLITSRPICSSILHPLISLRIEILGFTKEELHQYFKKCLENSAEALQTLLQKIKENPIIEGSCYLPLTASILVHLFKCGGNKLPDTQYGIFTELVCSCIFRHLNKTQQGVYELNSLDDLPPTVDEHFQQICKIAYDGIMEDRVVFNLGPNINTLGLLEGVESFAICGKCYSYNFIHLTLQELLGAIYMTTKLDASEQTEQFQRLFGQPRFNTVFQFFAARTKLQVSGMSDIVTQLAYESTVQQNSGGKSILLLLINCLFEAKDSALCQSVAGQLKHKLSLGDWFASISLTPADCHCIGYFLAHCRGFEVELRGCSIGDEHCNALFRHGNVHNLKHLDISNNSITDEGAVAISKAMANIRALDLSDNSISDKGAIAIAEAMDKRTDFQLLRLPSLVMCTT